MDDETSSEVGQQSTSTNMQQPLLSEHSSQFMQFLLDNDKFLQGIARQLRGEIYDYDSNSYQKKGRPKLNDVGVDWIMTELKTMTDKIFQTSNYTSEEIGRDIEGFEHDLINHLFAHAHEYDLNILADMDVIYHLVSHTVYAIRKKSQNATFFKGLSSSTQHTEVVSERPYQKQGGVFNKLKGSINI